MTEKLIEFALKQRFFLVSLMLLWIVVGIFSVTKLPVDSFPDVSNVQVQIITEPETMPTEEIETLVTFPIENALNGLPQIKQIRSNSSFGLSVVTAIFEDGTDVYWARNLVQQRLTIVQLPPEVPPPILGPVISTFSNILNYYVTSDRRSLTELRTLQDWQIGLGLRTVPGVANVVSYGGYEKEYQVLISPPLLRAYGLTVKQVADSVAANNENAGGKFIEQAGEEIVIRGLGRIQTVEDIKDIVLKSVNGVPVKVSQVAEVRIGDAFRRGAASIDGNEEAVTGMVFARKGANSKEVVELVRHKIKEIQSELPDDVKIEIYYDQSQLVDRTIHTVQEVLTISSGLVVAVLFALILDIRCSLIVAVVIPMSLLFSFTLMRQTGLSANLMTLGAVDFGVIVDAGVVMVENIFRHLIEAKSAGRKSDTLAVVTEAAKEVGRPILFSIGIIISVFIPLFALEGIEGRMFQPLALTYIYALVGALIVSLTLIPVLCYFFLRGNLVEKEHKPLSWLREFLRPVLQRTFAHPFLIWGAATGLLLASLCLVPFLGSEFVPTLDEGSILLRLKLAPSVSLTESRRINSNIERILKQFDPVNVIVARIGRSGQGSDLDGVDNADIHIGLKPKSEWKQTKEQLVNAMAHRLSEIPGLICNFAQPIADMIDDLVAGIRADLGIKIFGNDPQTIDRIASQIQAVTSTVRGASDVQRELIIGLPQLNIKLKRNIIARYGLNVKDVLEIVRIAIAGKVVSEVIETPKHFGLMVRFPVLYRKNIDEIKAIMVDTPSGARIPMEQLADIEVERGLVMINRENGKRRTAVLCNVRGRDLGSFVEELQRRVAKEVELPKGYRIVWGGQFENQQRAMARLSIVVPIVLLIIFVLLFASFGSLRNAALVMLNVPFAAIGGIVALFVSHEILSVPAVIGFIALFGVAVQNGVIMVSYIMQQEVAGHDTRTAAELGAEVRLRPVLMTALVAIVGFAPLLLSHGTGAEVQRPLATVVIGGLLTATPFTLILLPTLYVAFNKNRRAKPEMPPRKETSEALR